MIELERRDDVLILRLAHGKASALDVELCEAIASAVRDFEASDARAAVLTGTGRIFCAGLDLKRLAREGEPYVRRLLPALESAVHAAFTCRKPLVAALNGHAIAGGYVLACAADWRVSSDGPARLGLPELHVGVPFPTLVVEVLRASVAPPMLQEMLLLGGTFAPIDALARGVVDEIAPADSLLDAACAVAARLARLEPTAYALTKRKLREPAIEAWARRASGGDAEIVEQWCSATTLGAIREYASRL